jgi:SulP family sulfate permease
MRRVRRRLQRVVEHAVTRLRPGATLREALSEGYGRRELRADLMAGAIVGVVALPLSMALAIASGVPPQHGLYTAIVGGAVIAAFGGSRVQVSGPTAAFVVILAPISARWGAGGLMVASLMAGALLVGMGVLRLGRLIQFVPYPVTTGFTAGIAVVIGMLQVRDFLGLTIEAMPEHTIERVGALARALGTANGPDVAVGVLTLAVLVLWPKVARTKKVPAPLVALVVAGLAAWVARLYVPGFDPATIGSRFGGIPQLPPLPAWPWNAPGGDGGSFGLSFDTLRSLMGPAFAIAMLGAIESLLSATVADGMTGGTHDADAELVGQGIGNLVAPFFGGIAATGAIARTATNVRFGGRSPVAAMTHAAFVLLAVLALAPVLSHLPMAALAALLLVVAWNMAEAKHVAHVLAVAPRGDVLVLLVCFGLTVAFDMVVAVAVGVVLASLLFMERMADVASADLVSEGHPSLEGAPLPDGVVVYEVAGALFFGAAQKAMSTLRTLRKNVRAVVLDLRAVPVMDATGLVNLESAIRRLQEAGILVVLAGVRPQPRELLGRAGWEEAQGRLEIAATYPEGLARARAHVQGVGSAAWTGEGSVSHP